jgi:hypothetical protein
MTGEQGRGRPTDAHVAVAHWRWMYHDARWQWGYHALQRLYGELDRDAVLTHVTVGVTTPRGEALVYAVRLGTDDVQRVIVATDPAAQAAVQAVLEQAITDATVPSHKSPRPS